MTAGSSTGLFDREGDDAVHLVAVAGSGVPVDLVDTGHEIDFCKRRILQESLCVVRALPESGADPLIEMRLQTFASPQL